MARGHIRKRVYKSGTTWQIVIEHGLDENGDRKRTYKSTNGTKKEAEKLMQQMLNELEGGTFIEESKMTVATYLRSWIKTYAEPNLAPTTIDGYKSNVENYLIPNVGTIALQKLSPMHLQEMYLKLSKNGRLDGKGGLSPTTIRAIHRTLGKALDEALRMQQVKRNVSSLVTIPKVKPYKAEIYDEDEIISLLNVAKGTDMEIPITLGATLGLRRGEILGLKWSDINLIDGKMTISNNLVNTSSGAIFTTPKTDKSCRTLELSEGIIALLKKHRLSQKENKIKLGGAYKENDLVCCQPDGSWYEPRCFSKRFAWFLKKHGLKHIRLHDLRHSNATLMLTYGIPAKVASQRLGHSSISITLDLYSHVTDNMQKEVASKIENGIFNKLVSSN